MKKYKLNKKGLYVICGMFLLLFVGLLALVDVSFSKQEVKIEEEIIEEKKEIIEPVVESSSNIIIRPYTDDSVKIIKNYYNYQGTEEEQENSIIYYESTYMPNYAVLYGGTNDFEVVSILDGTVVNIKEDSLLGNIIEVQHENDLISVYQGVSNITVEVNQIVKQGEVIASSGLSNLNKEAKSSLLFEMLYKSQIINPEEYYNKDINNL